MDADSAAGLKQPHEDVEGQTNPQNPVLFSVDVSLLVGTLVASLAQARLGDARAYGDMHQISQGDLVVVTDHFGYSNAKTEDLYQSVGYLITIREEWASTNEEWAEYVEASEYRTADIRRVETHATYIQYGPDKDHVARWVNCEVVRAK